MLRHFPAMVRGGLVIAGLLGGLAQSGPARAQPVTVFAAASLTNALEEAAKLKPAGSFRFSFAASSTLVKQIEAGAPAEIFISADEAWMDAAEKKNLIAPGSRISVLGNALVLIAPAATAKPLALVPGVDLVTKLEGARLAVGDPAHVPVGRYAQQALTHLGIWSQLEPHLARADTVRAGLALVERGEAPLGIVYATDAAVAPKVAIIGTFPADSHMPVTYPFAILAGKDTPKVKETLAFLTTAPEVTAVYRRYGFSVR